MKASEYAQALYLATENKTEEEIERIFQNLLRILKERGHSTLLTSITREYEKITERKEGHNELLIRVADSSDVDTFVSQIEKDTQTLKAGTLGKKVVVDDTLVGGYELRANGTRIDRTYKRSLLTLYNNLITN